MLVTVFVTLLEAKVIVTIASFKQALMQFGQKQFAVQLLSIRQRHFGY